MIIYSFSDQVAIKIFRGAHLDDKKENIEKVRQGKESGPIINCDTTV
jgi:hypothetical protein